MAEKREIKRWTVYRNLWAGYGAYFIVERIDSRYASGYLFHNAKGNWKIKRARFFRQDLEHDTLHFPIVGKINLYDLVENSLADLLLSKDCDTCKHGAHWDGVVVCGKDGQRHERNGVCTHEAQN